MTLNTPDSGVLIPVVGVVGAAAGSVLTKFIDALFGRKSREVKALGDTIQIMADQQERFDGRLDAAETKLDDCERRHDDCEKRVKTVQSELTRLMRAKPVAAYHLNAPKTDPGRGQGK